nr:hypothetical protein [Escherichia coli]
MSIFMSWIVLIISVVCAIGIVRIIHCLLYTSRCV